MNETGCCVAYATDDGYARFMGISMRSLLEQNADLEKLRVFVLDYGISDENKRRLSELAEAAGREIVFIPVAARVDQLPLRMGARKISVVSYARLFLGSLLPEDCERVLYLDCDTLVTGSLRQIWETPMDGLLVAGVQDTVDSFFLKAIGLEKGVRYINAGVLLINLAAWRAEGLEKRFVDFIAARDGNVPHHDQGVINGVCADRRAMLPLRDNVTSNVYSFSAAMIRRMYDLKSYYAQDELEAARRDPAILHFTTGLLGRPWEENCSHPKKGEFERASNISPWKDLPLMPNTMKTGVRLAAFARRLLPDAWFAEIYRSLCWVMHQRK